MKTGTGLLGGRKARVRLEGARKAAWDVVDRAGDVVADIIMQSFLEDTDADLRVICAVSRVDDLVDVRILDQMGHGAIDAQVNERLDDRKQGYEASGLL
eukprot:1953565-Prymnesium_polylepis.1